MDEDIVACVEAQQARLVAVVALVTESRALAEEAVQEAFVLAWERSRRGESFTHMTGWVATVALNLARSDRRRRGAERRAHDRIGARAEAPREPDREIGLVVRSSLASLPSRQRDAVVLFYLLDLDVVTVAELLGISEGTVKTALSRGRRKLAVLLDGRGDGRTEDRRDPGKVEPR
jgi:RNA polymerase sigma-70 factor (ECF subfamily)